MQNQGDKRAEMARTQKNKVRMMLHGMKGSWATAAMATALNCSVCWKLQPSPAMLLPMLFLICCKISFAARYFVPLARTPCFKLHLLYRIA